MRVRELFRVQSGEFSFLWKFQMALGAMIVCFGLLIAVFPQILVALVAAVTILVGAALMGSAWRLKRLLEQRRGVSSSDPLEW